jgi:hypothetical protein
MALADQEASLAAKLALTTCWIFVVAEEQTSRARYTSDLTRLISFADSLHSLAA